jgi:hypothetical protein
MRDIRNLAGKLICRLDEDIGYIEIKRKGCLALLRFSPKTPVTIQNARAPDSTDAKACQAYLGHIPNNPQSRKTDRRT